MDILALLLYIILAIVLITLVIVIGWLYYDYVELKDNLNSNFSYVRRKFNDHDEKDEDLEEDIGTNNANIVTIDSTINGPPDGGIKEEINDIKAILGEPESEDGKDATGYFKVKELVGDFRDAGSPDATELASVGLADGLLATNNFKKTFHKNLNNYFEFGTQNTGVAEITTPAAIPDIGNMWHYDISVNDDPNDDRLKLIQDTTIAANMTINTDTDSSPNKHLKICNNKDDSDKVCYKLYVDDNGDLNIQSGLGGNATRKLIMGESTVPLPAGADTSSIRKSLRDQPHTHKYDKYDVNGDIVSTTSTLTDTAAAIYT
jgi:hypothetical protein|tara:strand:+ start:234 stop:1187 length:954 start_codon:yes stop_codon:yes gene_type:complete